VCLTLPFVKWDTYLARRRFKKKAEHTYAFRRCLADLVTVDRSLRRRVAFPVRRQLTYPTGQDSWRRTNSRSLKERVI